MATQSKEFKEWMEQRRAELKDLSQLGPTSEERVLADKIYDILGMVWQEYERTHDKEAE